MNGWGRGAAACAAGALLALVGPPTNLYAAPWLGMAALAYLLGSRETSAAGRGTTRWRRIRPWLDGSARGLAFGASANVVFFRFVPATVVRFTSLPFTAGLLCLGLLAILQGSTWAVAAAMSVQLSRCGVPRWVAFAIGVYAGTFIPGVFPWTPAGPVSPLPELIQLAELVGERGVAFLMALSAGLMAEALLPQPRASKRALFFVAGLTLVGLTFAEGKVRILRVERDRHDAPTVTVGLVEPAIDAVVRWDSDRAKEILADLTSLTRSAESQGAELTIWTEGAYPYPTSHSSRKAPVGARAVLAPDLRRPVLGGFVMQTTVADQWNSAALCTSDGAISRPQDKVHLLLFGEELPWVGRIPWVRRTFARGLGLRRGEGNVTQTSGPIRAGVLICSEDTLPEAGREKMDDRPNLLVNLTNDAWFEGSREGELHLRLAVPRAVESRRDLVRAVNLGPTSWVDAAGVVRGRYDGPPGVLLAKPALLEWALTPYDRWGDVPIALALVLVALARMLRARQASDPSAT